MLPYPPSGDPYLVALVKTLNEELLRREPQIVGMVLDTFVSGAEPLNVTALTATSVTISTLGSGGGAVSVGIADSGGIGYRVLRVPN
jgi:hypothetical protein